MCDNRQFCSEPLSMNNPRDTTDQRLELSSGSSVLPLVIAALSIYPVARFAVFAFTAGIEPGAEFGSTITDPAFLRSIGYVAVVALLLALSATAIGLVIGYSGSRAASGRAGSSLIGVVGGALLLLPLYAALGETGQATRGFTLLIWYALATVPFCIWRTRRAANAIPREMLDAARVDGCSGAEAFRLVALPLLGRALIANALFAFVLAWNLQIASALRVRGIGGILGAVTPLSTAGATIAFAFSIPLLIVFIGINDRGAAENTNRSRAVV